MILFGGLHWTLLIATALIAAILVYRCRSGRLSKDLVRWVLGYGLTLNEFAWWCFRYSHEGLRISNLPLQLCDVSLWATVLACIFLKPILVEFAYFAGIAGAGMALVTPDLWSPWPSYPAVYFFVTHGGIVIANIVLIYGGIAKSCAQERCGEPLEYCWRLRSVSVFSTRSSKPTICTCATSQKALRCWIPLGPGLFTCW